MIGQEGQGRESKGRGEDQLAAVGHNLASVRVVGTQPPTEAWQEVVIILLASPYDPMTTRGRKPNAAKER
jgi:hypothetical protein